MNYRALNKNANVLNVENQKKHKPKVKKSRRIGSKERLASPKPSTSRSCLRWSPTERIFDLKGKIIATSESVCQSDCSKEIMQVSKRKDTTKGTSVNTQFCKQSILGKPPSSGSKLYSVTPLLKSLVLPKVDKTNALSKPIISNSTPSTRESKRVQNDKVITLGIFRINPFKASRIDNFGPNKHVKASVKTKPITVSQPHVITKNDVNSKTNGFSPKDVKSTTKTRRPLLRNNPKNDKVASKSKIMEKDSKIYKSKKERVKSIALKVKKDSSDDETLTSGSDDEEYAMAVRNFKRFFKRKGRFVRQPREEKKSLWKRDDKKSTSDRKCFRCDDPNHLIGDCLKSPRNKDQKVFIGVIVKMKPRTKPMMKHVLWSIAK
nr:zinc finger protein [Tanacetum cinerariifolium]